MSLLVVGTVAFDAIETPFGKTDKIIGGAATYIGLSASKLFDKISLISVVGGDFPNETIEMFKNNNISVDGLQVKEKEKTFFWSGKYHKNMNTRETIDTQLNVLESFYPHVPEKNKKPECLMLGNLMPSVQNQVLEQLKQRPKMIVLDTMNFWMDHYLEDLTEAIKSVDVLTINDEEAEQLSGEKTLLKAAKKIISLGPKNLVIKKGEHGAFLFNKDKKFYCPALLLENVCDPTGAGDSFAGGFVGHLSKTKDYSFENIKKATIIGSAMASFCVEKFGIEGVKNATKDKINERVQELSKITKHEKINLF